MHPFCLQGQLVSDIILKRRDYIAEGCAQKIRCTNFGPFLALFGPSLKLQKVTHLTNQNYPSNYKSEQVSMF